MNAHFILPSALKAAIDPAVPARAPMDQLPGIVLAHSPIALWGEMFAYVRLLGCRDMGFIVMTERAAPPAVAKSSFQIDFDLGDLRRDLANGIGTAVLVDRLTLALPAFGPRGLEAALLVRLGSRAVGLPAWADSLGSVFQLAYSRFRQMYPTPRGDDTPLSEREREIMQWVVRGKSNSVIGAILGISACTVDTYMRRIFRKLDVADRTSAAMRAVALGAVA